ncbi:MAG: hypothetical protein RBU37_19050 [Myxococcota bacterium]|jgi:hypothetical protein|nr:hypothetical protein [Myxococcota bacterium]
MTLPRRSIVSCLLVCAALSPLLLSCVDECEDIACSPCPPAVMLVVESADQEPISNLTINTGSCHEQSDGWRCSADFPLGTHTLELSAEGYQSQTLTVEVKPSGDKGDECCGPCKIAEQYLTVVLEPL